MRRFQWHQFIFPPAESCFLAMLELHFPVDFRIDAAKLVTTWFMAVLHGRVGQATGPVDKVGAGLVERDRVGRGKKAEVWDDRRIRVPVTITGRRNLGNEVDEEHFPGFAGYRTEAVFGHFLHHKRGFLVPVDTDRLGFTDGDASTTAGTALFRNDSLATAKVYRVMGAGLEACTAGRTMLLRDAGGHCGVLLEFALAA